MDDFIALLVGVIGLGLLVLPVVSVVLATRARARLRAVEAARELDEQKLDYLYARVKALEARLDEDTALPAATSPSTASPTEAPAEPGLDEDTVPSAPASTPQEGSQPEDEQQTLPPPALAPASATPPPPEPPPPAAPAPPPAPPVPLEERLATLFTRVGAGALVLGVLYFFKYAVDNEWIGPTGRVLAGVVVGLGVLIGAELIRARTKPGYVHALSGVGLAILYVSAYASAAWYDLVSLQLAFAATAVILAAGAALAWRYRGEAILVLVLVAGLLTPSLLSTGQDRPFALFGYLLALTSAVLFVSAQRGFRISVGLAVLGVHLMAVGWYGKFFEVHDLRDASWAPDTDPAELVGAYHELSARIVPLAFAALFGAQWMSTAFALRARAEDPNVGRLRVWVVPLATVAAVFLHVAVCALLHDRPPALGAAVVAVGAASVLIMQRLDATRWLMVPMGAAFLVLTGLSQVAEDSEQTILIGLVGLWTAIYVVAFLRESLGSQQGLQRADAIRTQIALQAFAALACLMLLPDERVYAAAAAVAIAALPAAFVSVRAAQPALLLIGQVVNLLGLMLVAAVARDQLEPTWHPVMLGLALVWGLAHGFAALRLPEAQARPGAGLFALVLALLGPLTVGLITTDPGAETLRALLTAVTGAAALGAATYLSPRGSAWTSPLAALSLGLFAAAIAFGLSGAPVTVLWAALAAIAAAVLSRARTSVWLVTFQLLVLATGWRLAAVDIADAEHLERLFYFTQGAEGVLALPAWLNPRAYALLGSAVAFLVGAGALARQLARVPEAPGVSRSVLRVTAGLVAIVGYGLLTAVLIWETRASLLDLPAPPPMALDTAEFDAFWQAVTSAKDASAATLDVATTVVLGLVGVALVAGGFAFSDPFHRYLGLTVLLITVGKLVLWDVWRVSRIYRVVVLTAIGALLLVSGFLYARLKVLFTKGSLPTGSALLMLALGAGSAYAESPQLPTHRYAKVATVDGVDAPGDYRLQVPAALFAASTDPKGLEDVRLADAEGHMVPFVIQDVPSEVPSRWRRGRIYDPGETPEGGFRAQFELPEGARHCEVELELDAEQPFLRRTQIETGPSPEDLQTIAKGAIVYAVTVADSTFRRATVRYPTSAARWVRVTLGPDEGAGTTRIRGARFACRTPSARPPRIERALKIVKVEPQAPGVEARKTIITLDAEQAGLPIEALEIDVAAPSELVRRVEVQSSAFEQVWPPVGSGILYRVAGDYPSEDLTLSVRPALKRYFRLEVHDGDDPALEVRAVRGVWRPREILFRTSAPGPVRLFIGREHPSPARFDLEDILRRRIDRPSFGAATLGALADNPSFGKPDGDRPLPVTERYRGPIGVGIGIVVVLMGLWALRLIRSAEGAPEEEDAPEEEG